MSIPVSDGYREYYADGGAPIVKATLTLADSTELALTGADVCMGGVTVESSTSPMTSFSLGAAIVGTATVTLANFDGRFDTIDFEGATIRPYAGAMVGGSVEWALLGTYDVTAPDVLGSTMPLSCRDRMGWLEVPYSGVMTTYPATLKQVVDGICSHVGLTLSTASFANASYVVSSRPADDVSCIDVIGWVAALAGGWACMTPAGQLSIRQYNRYAFSNESWLDGGSFAGTATPYPDGDGADGGSFMSGGDSASGGGLGARSWRTSHMLRSLEVGVADVTITGVRVTAQDEPADADGTPGAVGESALSGSEGYVLPIEGNPLVLYGQASTVAAMVATAVVGLTFRPLTATILGEPSIVAGDAMLIVDRKSRAFRTYLTNVVWSSGGSQQLRNGAQAPSRQASKGRTGVMQLALAQVKAAVRAVGTATAAARAVADQAKLVAEATDQHFWTDASGVHVTEVEQGDWEDGGSASYHSGPNILINSLGMLLRGGLTNLASWTSGAVAFYDGLGNAAGNIMARFGRDGAQIGLDGESHVELDYHSMKMVDKDGTTFFHVSDLRGSNGLAEITDSFTGDGTTEMFLLSFEAASSSYVVEVNGVEVTSGIDKDVDAFFFDTAPNNGASINATYDTASQDAKAYTAGTRWSDGTVGPMSFVEGRSNIASGDCSHAEGFSTTASDSFAHAEGYGTVASGRYSHAEGFESTADGLHSHAQNRGTRALSADQTAIGRYNTEDANNTYAFMVGNGSGANQRSNALALQWDGTLELYSPLPVSSGGTGSDGYGSVLTSNKTADADAVSVASSTYTSLASLTLTKGTWLLVYTARFEPNATGNRYLFAHTSLTSNNAMTTAQRAGGINGPAVSGSGRSTFLNASRIVQVTSNSQTWHAVVWQNSGSTLATNGMFRAFRLL